MVFATKYRRKIFNEGIFSYMLERLKELGEHYPEIEILEINHDKDHCAYVGEYPAKDGCGKGSRDNQGEHKSKVERKIFFFEGRILGHRWNMVRWIFCFDSRNK